MIDPLRHTLQGFQLLEAQGDRVVFHHLSGIEQRARGGGLFATANDVGFSRFLCFNHLGEDGLHFTWQHDVFHPNTAQIQAETVELALDMRLDHLIDDLLVFQQFIQRSRAYGFTQPELQLAIQVIDRLGEFLKASSTSV